MICFLFPILIHSTLYFLCSFTLWRRTEAMRVRVWAFRDGPCTTSTTAPRRICGYTEHTVETFITTGSRRWHLAASLRETSSPVSWTWKPEPSPSARTERWETELAVRCCSKLRKYRNTENEINEKAAMFHLRVCVRPSLLISDSTGAEVSLWGCWRHWALSLCDVLQQ